MLDNAAYFIFDSEHLDGISSGLYGFCFADEGLLTEYEDLPGDITDAPGAWILVRRDPQKIEISQDSAGCFGLFLFRDKDYWALSNSFNHLLDFLKPRHRLTLNKDYADALLIQQLCVSVYGETLIREISWLDRRAIVSIDPATGGLSVTLRELDEASLGVDTEEGMRTLDAWHGRWSGLLQAAIDSWPGQIAVDVSGGFDTRKVLALVLSVDGSLERIKFNSMLSLGDDYEIASQLAERFGFALNRAVPDGSATKQPFVVGRWERVFSSLCFERAIYDTEGNGSPVPERPMHVPQLTFRGFGGGLLRSFDRDLDEEAYVKKMLRRTRGIKGYPERDAARQGAEAIVRRSFAAVGDVRRQTASGAGPVNGLDYYRETRNRSHFGMSVARLCLGHMYEAAPLMDPLLLKLRSPDDEKHALLLDALILTRYHEGLAAVPIEGGRAIPEETLELARVLNGRFPYAGRTDSEEVPSPQPKWQMLRADAPSGDAPLVDANIAEQVSCAAHSETVAKTMSELYGKATKGLLDPNLDKRHPHAGEYAAVVIAKVAEDCRKGGPASADLPAFVRRTCVEPRAKGNRSSALGLKVRIFFGKVRRRLSGLCS